MNSLFVLADAATTTGQKTGSALGMILYFAVLALIMWLLIIRPQRKKEKEIQEMLNNVKVGDTVLTTGGLYGKVVDMVNDICIIELGLNKGVRVPLQKNNIAAIKEPDMAIKKEEKEETKKEDKKEAASK
ncbi:preprotein translocase subunit YajC [Defluviitalea saccharophila]|uniref:Preprotein translocase subunit YajC n=1 Tax=Defluviitalea saccharophila TaxID=879970 RepID=A0ABZ2YAH4_9FIRM|nr:preprotein translocase subunit YajC [Candidatus Epulonipiscium sp.]